MNATAFTPDQVDELHHAFFFALYSRLGEQVLRETMAENRRRRAADPKDNACATHDECDSNEVMALAFERVFDRKPDLDSDTDLGLWNAAWDRFIVDCTSTTEAILCDEYEVYCKAERLPYASADELIHGNGLSPRQRRWVSGFYCRWETIVYTR